MSQAEAVYIPYKDLDAFTYQVSLGVGVTPENAAIVADNLS